MELQLLSQLDSLPVASNQSKPAEQNTHERSANRESNEDGALASSSFDVRVHRHKEAELAPEVAGIQPSSNTAGQAQLAQDLPTQREARLSPQSLDVDMGSAVAGDERPVHGAGIEQVRADTDVEEGRMMHAVVEEAAIPLGTSFVSAPAGRSPAVSLGLVQGLRAQSTSPAMKQLASHSGASKDFEQVLTDPWQAKRMHVARAGDQVDVWIRDTGLSTQQASSIVYRLMGDLIASGLQLRDTTINGQLAYRSGRSATAHAGGATAPTNNKPQAEFLGEFLDVRESKYGS
jgi:hypothetical protein